MKNTITTTLTILFLISCMPANAYQQTYQGQASYIAAGTPLQASLDTTLGSEFSNIGDRFTVTLASPLYAGSQLIAPPGSKAEAVLINVEKAGRTGKPGSIDFRVTNVITPDGRRIPLSASVNKQSFKLSADGGRVSNYAKATTAGAAGGALSGLIGGAISGGKFGRSTAIGTGIGAGVGLLGGTLKKGQEFILKQGTTIPFVVDTSNAVPTAAPAPTQVRQYGSDFHPGGYHQPGGYQQQMPQQGGYQPIQTQQPPMQQQGGGFRDPYSSAPPVQQTAPTTNYQQQQPYNPYLE
jgi:hypothetical protein